MTAIMSAASSQSLAGSGVCSHSSDEFWSEYAIFSVGNNALRDNQFRNWCYSEGIPYKSMYGCYKGQTETSFLVHLNDWPKALNAGFLDGQESVLMLSKPVNLGGGRHYRSAQLLYLADGSVENIGRCMEKARDWALKQDAWTYDPLTNTYWCCE